jgi:hypothetical protein
LVAQALAQRGQPTLPPEELAQAWGRLEFTSDPLEPSLLRMAADGRALGYLPAGGDAARAVDRRFLDAALRRRTSGAEGM